MILMDGIYLRCRGLDGFDFGLCLADTLPFGELGDFFDFGDCSGMYEMEEKILLAEVNWESSKRFQCQAGTYE